MAQINADKAGGGCGRRRLGAAAILLGVVFGALAGSVRAQEGPELPPVLRDADVFAEGVEVVERLALLHEDNVRRTFYYFDPMAETWAAIPYPDELETVGRVVWQPGEDTAVINPQRNYYTTGEGATRTWYLDLASGEFSRPELVCGNFARAAPGAGTWEWWIDPETEQFRLCNTATGDLAPLLPDDVQAEVQRLDWHDLWRVPPGTSPDGAWVVFASRGFTRISLLQVN